MRTVNKAVLAQMEVLAGASGDIEASMKELAKQLVCECCEGQDGVAFRRLMTDRPVCKHCVYVWYDGCTDPSVVRAESLKKQGRT